MRLATDTTAPVLEVFRSIQGEGLFAGRPMVFARLRGCPLRCRYCDTPGSWELPARARARIEPHGGPESGTSSETRSALRPAAEASARQLADWIRMAEGPAPLPVSLTGGEPLVWPDFACALKGELEGRRLHLETGGGHVRALERVLDHVDHVSLDLKLPEQLDAPVEWPLARAGGGAEPWGEPLPRNEDEWGPVRRRALELVAGRDACAKLVISAGAAQRYAPLLDDVALLAPRLPVFLQPVSPRGGVLAPRRAELESLVDLCVARGLDVRVVPQVHRFLKLP